MKQVACLTTLAIALAACSGEPATSTGADMVLTNARVHTVNGAAPWAEAVAITGGRIAAVGSAAEIAAQVGDNTKLIDVGGRLVIPGIQDSHIHPIGAGVEAGICDLNSVSDLSGYRETIRGYADNNPDVEWILGGGWSMDVFGPGAKASRLILDELVPDRPVYLTSADGHSGWANSKALELAGITSETPDPVDGIIDRDPQTGEIIGSLQEGAMSIVAAVAPAPGPAERAAGLRYSVELLNSYGITAMQDAAVVESDLQTYLALQDAGDLSMRVVGSIWWERDWSEEQIETAKAWREKYSQGRVNVGTIKIMQDGVMENYTAVMLAPYKIDEPTRGIPMFEPESLKGIVTAMDAAGFQVHFHALGDGAVRHALDAIEAARNANGPADNRHHLSHLQAIDPADYPRFAELGAVANFQPLWAMPDKYITELTLPFISEEVGARLYPIKSIQDAGGMIAFGSDWSVSTANPFPQIETAITRKNAGDPALGAFLPEQGIDVESAVEAFTLNAAFVNHLDDSTGSIEVGKYADLIVLDQDIFEINPDDISETKVLLTLLEGEPVHGSLDGF